MKFGFQILFVIVGILFSPISPKAQENRITLEGHVKSNILTDHGKGMEIGLSGLEVRLLQKKRAGFLVLGNSYTDARGHYQFLLNQQELSRKIKTTKIYLEILSRTDTAFKVISRNGKGVYRSKNFIGDLGKSTDSVYKDVFINDPKTGDAFRAVHWANQGFEYFKEQGVPLGKGLKIKVNAQGSYTNVYLYAGKPTIHLKKGAGTHENTIYHEFGHYAMYRLQNNNMSIPYGKNGVNFHGWSSENTGLLAWVEGWALAVQLVLDAAYWQEDQEYGLTASRNITENLRIYPSIENGLCSEYHIGNALFDLWDGPDKGLPEENPALGIHGWNDTAISKRCSSCYPWKGADHTSLSLAEIAAPLQTVKKKKDLKNVRNISHYYQLLLSQFLDCEDKAKISRVFLENRVVWNIGKYNSGQTIGNLSTDPGASIIKKEEKGSFYYVKPLKWRLVPKKWTDTYLINPVNDFLPKEIHIQGFPDSTVAISDSYWLGMKEDARKMSRRTNLCFNIAPLPATGGNSATFYTCGGNEILVRNGTMELGDPDGTTSADVTISDQSFLQIAEFGELIINQGSVLRVAKGGSFHVKTGAMITLKKDAAIIVEEGAFLCIEKSVLFSPSSGKEQVHIHQPVHEGINPASRHAPRECEP